MLSQDLFAPAGAEAEAPEPSAGRRREGRPSRESRHRERARQEPAGADDDKDLPAPGTVIDKYRLDAMVGKGGFAAVYRATHLVLRVPVAIKLLRPRALRKHPNIDKLLCEEASLAARINHASVVRIMDVTQTEKLTYVVMEFINGPTLSNAVKQQGPLPLQRLLKLTLEVVAGLKAAYAQGIIHRDIKPSNIMLADGGSAKIIDLGLALPLHRAKGSGGGIAPGSSGLVGTPGYIAPEQRMSPDSVDFRADVFSLGATIYYGCTGTAPRALETESAQREWGREGPWDPKVVLPRCPPALQPLLGRMLAMDRRDRHGSYDALAAELEELAAMERL